MTYAVDLEGKQGTRTIIVKGSVTNEEWQQKKDAAEKKYQDYVASNPELFKKKRRVS